MKSKEMIYGFLFLIPVIGLCLGLFLLHGPKEAPVAVSSQGTYNLIDADFSEGVYRVDPIWDSWNEKMYSPEELETAGAPVAHDQLGYTKVDFVTHRLQMKLPTDIIYGLSYASSNFSMRIYIDGDEAFHVGEPGTTRETTEPSVKRTVTYFTPETEWTEIVVQVANFVHQEGGQPPSFVIGSAAGIAEYERAMNMKQGIVFGCLLTACLFYLSIFLLNRKQVSSLLFSVLCLLLAFSSGNFFEQFISNWYLGMRLEYIAYVLAACILALLVNNLFPNTLRKWTIYTYLICSSIFSMAVLFTDPSFYTSLRVGFQIISVTMILYGVLTLALAEKNWSVKKLFAFLGIFLFAIFIIIDILVRNDVSAVHFFAGKTFNSAAGMVLFVFCYMLVLSIEQREVNTRMEKMHTALESAEKSYQELMKHQSLEKKPNDKLSEFKLSKREKEVALLLIDGKSREEIMKLLCISLGTVNTHCSHIYRKTGSGSVVELIQKLQKN